jgi:hypothetical protein
MNLVAETVLNNKHNGKQQLTNLHRLMLQNDKNPETIRSLPAFETLVHGQTTMFLRPMSRLLCIVAEDSDAITAAVLFVRKRLRNDL